MTSNEFVPYIVWTRLNKAVSFSTVTRTYLRIGDRTESSIFDADNVEFESANTHFSFLFGTFFYSQRTTCADVSAYMLHLFGFWMCCIRLVITKQGLYTTKHPTLLLCHHAERALLALFLGTRPTWGVTREKANDSMPTSVALQAGGSRLLVMYKQLLWRVMTHWWVFPISTTCG